MFYPSQNDITALFQKTKQYYIKLYLLNKQYQTIDELQGELIDGDITIDANSDIRRVASFSFIIKDLTYFTDKNAKIWMDKFVDIRIGVDYHRMNEILWYKCGLFIFNENSFQYNNTTKTITCNCIDIMGYLTGLRAGSIRGSKMIIPYGNLVTEVVKNTISQLGNITNYMIRPNENESYLTIPYDLEFSTGTTIYEILKKISELYPATEFFFDTEGTFRWGYIPTASNDINVLDNDILNDLIINESLSNSFSDIKNCIEVWGKDDYNARILLFNEMPSEPNIDFVYKIDPLTPFSVEKIGEVWDVKHSGEYAMIYSDELALDRAKYELYLSTSARDSISLESILIPFLDVNQKFSYRVKAINEMREYITKRLSFNITSGTMRIEAIRFTPLYSWL